MGQYKWENEGRLPTDDEVANMSGDEYDYLQKRMDEGYPKAKKVKADEPKKKKSIFGGLRGVFDARKKILDALDSQ